MPGASVKPAAVLRTGATAIVRFVTSALLIPAGPLSTSTTRFSCSPTVAGAGGDGGAGASSTKPCSEDRDDEGVSAVDPIGVLAKAFAPSSAPPAKGGDAESAAALGDADAPPLAMEEVEASA